MMLVEETAPAVAALPVAAFRDHLRMGSGFGGAEDPAETAALAGYLRAAIATIEARTGKVLLTRRFRLRLEDWREPEGQPLPLAPVHALHGIEIDDGRGEGRGEGRSLPEESYRLVPDYQRPWIAPAGALLPAIPERGFVTISFTAGFGADWASVPADLAQAVMLLAARYYEDRSFDGIAAALPQGVAALIERWRLVRTLGGGGNRRIRP